MMAGEFPASGDAPLAIPCWFYRGGTSRGALFRSEDLPHPREVIERILLAIFGSPDERQIDGIGGTTSQSSKAMIVRPAEGSEADVRMLFAQVGVRTAVVDWGGNCGNMTSAVGPFAIEAGFVAPVEPVTRVRIVSENTGSRVIAHVPVRGGRVESEGDYEIPGVPGRAARIDLEWLEPGGTVTGRVLPTGSPVDQFTLADGRRLTVSIVDAANPVVFCEAGALGLEGTELPPDLERRPDVLAVLEAVRSMAAEILGVVKSRKDATRVSPGLPKVALVAPPADYRRSDGRTGSRDEHDLQGRLMSMQTPHRSYAVSGGISTAVAALVPGTVVHACRAPSEDPALVRIAHPYGVMDVRVEMDESGARPRSARMGRTARLIMSGLAYVPASVMIPAETGARR
jgi:methylitaconate Delta-isomerase